MKTRFRHPGVLRDGQREIACEDCDRGAVIRWKGRWLCAAHFDAEGTAMRAASLKRQRAWKEASDA